MMKIRLAEVKSIVKYLERGVECITISGQLGEVSKIWLAQNEYEYVYIEELEAVQISKPHKMNFART